MESHSFLTQLTMARANIQAATNHLDHALAMSEAKMLKWSSSHSLRTVRKNLKRQLALLRKLLLIIDAAFHPDEPLSEPLKPPQNAKITHVKSQSPQNAPPADPD